MAHGSDNNKHSEENGGFQKDHWASWGFTCFTHGITEAQHGEYFFYKACIKTEEESTSMTKRKQRRGVLAGQKFLLATKQEKSANHVGKTLLK